MMQWTQDYYAVAGNVFLTALCAAIPMIFLFWALAVHKMKGHLATFFALVLTTVIAIFVYGMPVVTTLSATAFGVANGIFPLCWLIFNAVLLYNLIIRSGNFEIIKS